jgi:hypothetical protein
MKIVPTALLILIWVSIIGVAVTFGDRIVKGASNAPIIAFAASIVVFALMDSVFKRNLVPLCSAAVGAICLSLVIWMNASMAEGKTRLVLTALCMLGVFGSLFVHGLSALRQSQSQAGNH